jgi:hypothetical protein
MGILLLNNRDLARRLGINLARWKRWSREFLPPDPLAGRQSGYARQYYLEDAFRTYLGGHLVAHLNLSVGDARQILEDLGRWMAQEDLGFDMRGQRRSGTGSDSPCVAREICIHTINGGFGYRDRRLVSRRRIHEGPPARWEEHWVETQMPDSGRSAPDPLDDPQYRTLRLSALMDYFQRKMADSIPSNSCSPDLTSAQDDPGMPSDQGHDPSPR